MGERRDRYSQQQRRSRFNEPKKRWIGCLSLIALGCLAALLTVDPPSWAKTTKQQWTDSSGPFGFKGETATGKHGAVAVETKECSTVGVEILRQGGNAVDSAIASALCIGVMNSFATGIGGGGFMLIRSPNGTYEFIDFRETAPQAASQDMYKDDPMLAQRGGLAVAVPGEIRGFEMAHKRHGVLPWEKIFEPAIKVAREGFKTPDYLHEKLKKHEEWLLEKPEWASVYAPNGYVVRPGDIVKRPALAVTLQTIATEGPDAFYEGPIAEAMVKRVRETGGILTLEDLRGYKPLIRPTVHTYYHGRKITTCTAPTSGQVLVSMLNLLERYNLPVLGKIGVNIHRMAEAMKFGYAFRTEFGDPDFTHLDARYEQVASKDWADEVRGNLTDNETHDPLYYNPKYDHISNHGTMHLSVVDSNEGAVALTSTVNLMFGSRVIDPVTGIILNDEMDDFSIPGVPNDFGLYPSADNYIAPGKRPLSSITPVIVEQDGHFELALGGSGGSQIATASLNVLLNVLDFGMELYDAVESPRLHHQLMPNRASLELGFDRALTEQLVQRNHKIYWLTRNDTVSAVQAVQRLPDGTVQAASDPRKYGLGAAY
ncbi:gamma-glutamyltranspeptidase [Hesseltinella vesiculosa]|uniref:Glutathione hydrolase n=1 Tax=Hesseltinella vesiculosa TaxID=101127 RepID=A0A1X2GFW9_9FUNG|nr:gamma-glutamyltranspeptidase [Hesseltinella vesiculosa]